MGRFGIYLNARLYLSLDYLDFCPSVIAAWGFVYNETTLVSVLRLKGKPPDKLALYVLDQLKRFKLE